MARKIILFNKPYGVLSQFTGENHDVTLKRYISTKGVYAAGRLDKDSEGLLLLTNDMAWRHKLMDPKYKLEKSYWVQVENEPSLAALEALRTGVSLKDGVTKPAKVRVISPPRVWQRLPPVRYRASIPTAWLEIKLTQGKNRQIRRMTAAVGFPTLRLIRFAIGKWQLNDLLPGEWKEFEIV